MTSRVSSVVAERTYNEDEYRIFEESFLSSFLCLMPLPTPDVGEKWWEGDFYDGHFDSGDFTKKSRKIIEQHLRPYLQLAAPVIHDASPSLGFDKLGWDLAREVYETGEGLQEDRGWPKAIRARLLAIYDAAPCYLSIEPVRKYLHAS